MVTSHHTARRSQKLSVSLLSLVLRLLTLVALNSN